MPQRSAEDIWQRFGSEFCVCPFLGGFYQSHRVISDSVPKTTNTIVPCSVFDWDGRNNNHDIVNDSIIESVNTEVWRRVRRHMVSGKYWQTPECRTCHDTERLGGDPPRIGAMKHFAEHYHGDIIADVESIMTNDYRTSKIVSLDWYPSNYCNYSCIMCSGGASSSRMSFEIKVTRQNQKIVINSTSQDFFDVLRDVEIINFTGGETVMQPQVTDMIRYLVDNRMASNKTIFLLTNASSFPDDLEQAFAHFRCVIYMCSIDGIGSVIEYQRRGSHWPTVEHNSLRILKHPRIRSVINIVVTAVNAPGLADFVDWLYANQVLNGVSVSPVFRTEHLFISAMPVQLRQHVVVQLKHRLVKYSAIASPVATNCVRTIESMISVIENSQAANDLVLLEFKRKIAVEDQHSQMSLAEAVPAWAPYL